ncbi:MAG TPA: peptide ABC transporter substrate-binding protein [Ktedonobacteraceae bacterium]|nr:peptide ABC transporter substrate-binding protein [Ktedonobacteraceae bacterium]
MRYNKTIFTIFTCSLLLLLLSSCDLFGGGNPTPTAQVKAAPDKQILKIPMIGVSDITTFDPALAADQASISAVQMIFTGLVQLDDHQQVRPELAQRWSVSPDGLSWTFRLKPGLKFSDGTPLTSMDVAYSIDRALQPTTKSAVAPIYLGLIRDADRLLLGSITTLINDSLLTPDPQTIIIQTKKKAAYFLSMLAYPSSYVVEKRLVQTFGANFTDHLMDGGGAGPFRVAQYTHGKAIDFVFNPNYVDARPQLREVIFTFYPQAAAAYNAYLSGDVDMTGVPLATYASDRQRGDFHQVTQLWIDYYTMNYLVKPFDNIDVRQAFALAIDKTAITKTVWNGAALPTNHIVPQGMSGYNPGLTGPDGTQSLQGNPQLAKSLLMRGLQAEGWASIAQMPPIKLTYASDAGNFGAEVTAMIGMWQNALGVTVMPNPVPYNTLLAQVVAATGNQQGLQMWGLTWAAEYPDPQDFLTRQFDAGVPNNNMNYGQNSSSDAAAQQRTQQQLETADADLQQQARLQTYQRAEQQLVKDVAWLPVDQLTRVYLLKPYVVGLPENAQGFVPPDDWANIYIAQA